MYHPYRCNRGRKLLITLFARATATLTLLLCLLIIVVRVLPYDRSREEALRAFLFTPGCEPPCVMGITPGVTTREDMRAIVNDFDAKGWIKQDGYFENGDDNYYFIMWRWNMSPSFHYGYDVPNTEDHYLSNAITVDGRYVDVVQIITNFTYSDVQFMFGKASTLSFNEAYKRLTIQYSHFQATYFLDDLYCINSTSALFSQPSFLAFGRELDTSEDGTRWINHVDFASWRNRMLSSFCP
jgi:hypothetical protein